jgi:hypothetical protein
MPADFVITPYESRDTVNGWKVCKRCMTAPEHGSCQFLCTVLLFVTPLHKHTYTHALPHPHANAHISALSLRVNVGLEAFFTFSSTSNLKRKGLVTVNIKIGPVRSQKKKYNEF